MSLLLTRPHHAGGRKGYASQPFFQNDFNWRVSSRTRKAMCSGNWPLEKLRVAEVRRHSSQSFTEDDRKEFAEGGQFPDAALER
jgi:hypothetical protein